MAALEAQTAKEGPPRPAKSEPASEPAEPVTMAPSFVPDDEVPLRTKVRTVDPSDPYLGLGKELYEKELKRKAEREAQIQVAKEQREAAIKAAQKKPDA